MTVLLEGLLQVVIGLAQQILAQVFGISQRQANQFTEDDAALAFVPVGVTNLAVTDPVYGLAAIQAELATFQATTAVDVTSILAAIAATQQTGSPVTLPATPPSGYGSPSDQEICDAVWEETPSTLPQPMYELMVLAGQLASPFSTTTDLDGTLGYFTIEAVAFNVNGTNFTASIPVFDPSDILSTEGFLACLTRQNPSWSLTQPFGTGGPLRLTDVGGGTGAVWDTTIDVAHFNELKSILYPPTAGGAPVWPGLAGVTLGSIVGLADGLVVPGPLAGVLIVITSVPTPISYYPFGSIRSYVRAGAIVFTNDNGDSEFPQPFGPNDQIILCRDMVEAASATIRLPSGVVGTAQPFTIV